MIRKRHSLEEIAAKLRHAEELASKGKLQTEIAEALGVSIMTFHRWRKMPLSALSSAARAASPFAPQGMPTDDGAQMSELRIQNSRLRRLVTDLMLEKVELEERLQAKKAQQAKSPKQ